MTKPFPATMKHCGWLVGALAILLSACARSEKVCVVCQRAECRGFAFRLTLANGRTIETCCPRCGLHYLHSHHLEARTLEATDLASGRWIDATKAVYVCGSDTTPCAPKEARRDGYGCCFYKGYDRCQPSLVAFAATAAAAAFQKQHGGQILPFSKLVVD